MLSVILLPLVLFTADAETCSVAEIAYYEAQGWDAYECDGDKAHAADANVEFPTLESEER